MPQLGVTTRLPLDAKERTWAGARNNQHQTTLRSAERDVKETPCLGLVREILGIAGHDDHAVALQALRLVDGADGLLWRLRARIDTAVGNLRKSAVGGIEIAKADRFPKFSATVDFDIGEVSVCGGKF
jgi:hypothetical protein